MVRSRLSGYILAVQAVEQSCHAEFSPDPHPEPRLPAEGFFGETVDKQNDASGPISLNVNLSEDDGLSRQGTLQVRFNLDEHTCEFGKSTTDNNASTIQMVFDDKHHKFEEMTEDLVREIAEQFVLDLIAGNSSVGRQAPLYRPR